MSLGADALGLNFYPGSPRCLDPARDAGWLRALPAAVRRVAVVVATALTLLSLADDDFAALELVDDGRGEPVEVGAGFSHLAVQVESVDQVLAALRSAGFTASDVQLPGGPAGPRTSWAADPDGYRIELTEWPDGHPAGITAADFPG